MAPFCSDCKIEMELEKKWRWGGNTRTRSPKMETKLYRCSKCGKTKRMNERVE